MKRLLVAAAALAALTVTGCGGSGPGSLTVHGTVQVFANPLNGATVQDAYPDIAPGSQVTVTNASGAVIGTGSLVYDSGTTKMAEQAFAAAIPGTSASTYSEWVEAFSFTVRIPGGLARYGIEAGQNRGTLWFTAAQMRKGPALSLGSMTG